MLVFCPNVMCKLFIYSNIYRFLRVGFLDGIGIKAPTKAPGFPLYLLFKIPQPSVETDEEILKISYYYVLICLHLCR